MASRPHAVEFQSRRSRRSVEVSVAARGEYAVDARIARHQSLRAGHGALCLASRLGVGRPKPRSASESNASNRASAPARDGLEADVLREGRGRSRRRRRHRLRDVESTPPLDTRPIADVARQTSIRPDRPSSRRSQQLTTPCRRRFSATSFLRLETPISFCKPRQRRADGVLRGFAANRPLGRRNERCAVRWQARDLAEEEGAQL